MTGHMDGLNDVIQRAIDARHAAEERACEAALQSGTCGVLVDPEGARPDPRVPYGYIWHAPHGLPED